MYVSHAVNSTPRAGPLKRCSRLFPSGCEVFQNKPLPGKILLQSKQIIKLPHQLDINVSYADVFIIRGIQFIPPTGKNRSKQLSWFIKEYIFFKKLIHKRVFLLPI